MKIKDLRTEELEVLSTINDKLEQKIIDDVACEEVKNELIRRSNMLDNYIGKTLKREFTDGFTLICITKKNDIYPYLLFDEIVFRNDGIKIEFNQDRHLFDVSYIDKYKYAEISKDEYDLILNKIKSMSNELTKFCN